MKRVYYVDQERIESYLPFNRELGLTHYINQLPHVVLASGAKKLLCHFTAFAEFLDALSDALYKYHQQEEEKEEEMREPLPIVVDPLPVDDIVRPWYEIAGDDDDDEPSTDIMDESPQQEALPPQQQQQQPLMIDTINIGQLCSQAWNWHNDVIQRTREQLTSYYAYSYMLSWVSFCRLFYLNIFNDRAKFARFNESPLSDHAYNQSIQNIVCIIVSDEPVGHYSIRETWNTLNLLVPTMYQRQYSLEMKEYMHIVLFRYATFLAHFFGDSEDEELFDDPSFVAYRGDDETLLTEEEQRLRQEERDIAAAIRANDENGAEGEESDDDDECNGTLTVEPFDEYKSLEVPIHADYAIKSNYILEGELFFYNQLLRLNLSAHFMACSEITLAYNRYAGNYSEILIRCLDVCVEMINTVTSSKVLRYETGERYKTGVAPAHLYHGEKERFTRAWPGSSNEPGDVIARYRPNDNLKISETRRMSIAMVCTAYQTEMHETIRRMKHAGEESDANHNNSDNKPPHRLFPFHYTEYEREMVLLTHVTVSEWLNYGAYKDVDTIRNTFIIEEMRPLHDIDQIIVRHGERHRRRGTQKPAMPYMVKLVQVYYVVDINSRDMRVYATHFFFEAVLLWLALACKYKLVPLRLIHTTLIPMITTLQEFLLV